MRRYLAAGAALLFIAGCQTQSQGKQETIAWLQTQGMDKGSAAILASNKPALRQYLLNRGMAGQDDAYCRSLGAAKGSSAYVQCRTSISGNRAVYQPPKRSLSCTSRVVFGTLKTECD